MRRHIDRAVRACCFVVEHAFILPALLGVEGLGAIVASHNGEPEVVCGPDGDEILTDGCGVPIDPAEMPDRGECLSIVDRSRANPNGAVSRHGDPPCGHGRSEAGAVVDEPIDPQLALSA